MMKRSPLILAGFTLLLPLGALLLSSCGDEESAGYEEITEAAPAMKKSPHSHSDGSQHDYHKGVDMTRANQNQASQAHVKKAEHHLAWVLPTGWSEAPAKSGMRIATFKIDKSEKLDIALFKFKGDGGGLKGNIGMWANQTSLSLSPEEVGGFIKKATSFKTSSGLDAIVLDFSSLIEGDQAKNIVVAIITLEKDTVFLKLMGPKGAMQEYLSSFKNLAESISVKL